MEPYPTKDRSSGPSVRIRVSKGRRRLGGPILAVVLVVSLMIAVGVAVLLVYSFSRHDGADSPESAVRGFFGALLQGNVNESIKFLHPREQSIAKKTIALFEKNKVPVDQVVRRTVQAIGRGTLDFEVGTVKASGEDKWEVEVILRSNGLPMRRTRMPVHRESGRFYVAANPFAGPGH
jgi:hypothetical protein